MKAVVCVAAGLVLLGAVGHAADPARPSRIEWEGDVFPAFKKAIKDKKRLVVYFHKDYCQACRGPCDHCRAVNEILRGEAAGAMANQAVWVWQTVGIDDDKKNVAKLMKDLKIDRVPTLVLLEADSSELRETGRIVGKYEADKYLKKLRELLEEDGVLAAPPGIPVKSP